MNVFRTIRGVLGDRRRSQRGSVLSGVLIMTAFVAVISGALMTELSTNFLIAHGEMTRVNYEATVNSAMEITLSQLGTTSLNQPCPAPPAALVNNLIGVASYSSCWPTVDVRSPQFLNIRSSSGPFNVDGAHVQLSGLNDYIAGDSSGNVYDYSFGSSSPRWTVALGGSMTAPPTVLNKPGSPGTFLDVIPMTGPACPSGGTCLVVRWDNTSNNTQGAQCVLPTASAVLSQPAGSPTVPGLLYYMDGFNLSASDVNFGGACDPEDSIPMPGTQPVLVGMSSFRCTSGCSGISDYIYAVQSGSGSNLLVQYKYSSSLTDLDQVNSWSLSFGTPSGMSALATGLPTNLAIAFRSGAVSMYSIDAGGASLVRDQVVPAGITDAPSWCIGCGNQVAVGAQNGGLYVYSSALNPIGSITGAGSIVTSPSADGAGDWYFGSNDGYVHEVQLQAGGLVEVNRYGPMNRFGSGVQAGGCPTGICVYGGTTDSNLWMVPLDARDAVVTACLSSAPPACDTGLHARLWASVEVGAANDPQTVHVRGWSYYSP